jgi:predicted RecA/RadA family phage recombinase
VAANECIPYYEPSDRITAHCEANVTGKCLVDISDPVQAGGIGQGLGGGTPVTGGNIVVSPTAAGGMTIGVAGHDQVAGKKVPVIQEGIVPVTAGAAITAGQEVEATATGKVIPQDTGRAVGRAYGSAANNADCPVRLYDGPSGAAF